MSNVLNQLGRVVGIHLIQNDADLKVSQRFFRVKKKRVFVLKNKLKCGIAILYAFIMQC